MKLYWAYGAILLLTASVCKSAVNEMVNTGNELPVVINIADCGAPNRTITIQNFSLNPNPIPNPGKTNVSSAFTVLHRLPSSGLKLKIFLEKLEPRRMRIPCFRRFGSCSYDICRTITDYSSLFCPIFPSNVLCSCQLEAGIYSMKNLEFPLPNFGRIIRKIMEGSYTGNATVVDSQNREHGCVRFQFSIRNKKNRL